MDTSTMTIGELVRLAVEIVLYGDVPHRTDDDDIPHKVEREFHKLVSADDN